MAKLAGIGVGLLILSCSVGLVPSLAGRLWRFRETRPKRPMRFVYSGLVGFGTMLALSYFDGTGQKDTEPWSHGDMAYEEGFYHSSQSHEELLRLGLKACKIICWDKRDGFKVEQAGKRIIWHRVHEGYSCSMVGTGAHDGT